MMVLDTAGIGLMDELDRIYVESGVRGVHRWLIANLQRFPDHNNPYYLAESFSAIGERDSAFYWLEKAHQQRCHYLTEIKINPDLDSLRSDPRFDELLRKMNLLD